LLFCYCLFLFYFISANGNNAKIEKKNNGLSVIGADEIIIIYSGDTNYIQSKDERFEYLNITKDVVSDLKKVIESARSKGYENIYNDHKKDYEGLRNGLKLDIINNEITNIPTKYTGFI
jgi:Zn-finger protein